MRLSIIVAVGVALAAGLAQAADPAQGSGGIQSISDGVGLDSREELLSSRGNYNLWVVLTLADGEYLGGAEITIRDHSGRSVLETKADGPWLFAKLPGGHYTVNARAHDSTRSARVTVAATGLKRVALTWKRDPA
jgi:hypothetical protein